MAFARKYTRATQSSNLKNDDRHFDTDTLAAMALSGEYAIGHLLFRVKYANDATSHTALRDKWALIIRGFANRRKWPQHISPHYIAHLSMDYWLSDVCTECTGRGYPVILNTPSLDANECTGCRGTGKKPLDCDPKEKKYIEDAVDLMTQMTLRAGDSAIRKLRDTF